MSTQIKEINTKTYEAPEVPEWLDNTPESSSFELCMCVAGLHVQRIEISRDEFIELKDYLASMRGIRLKEALKEPAGMAGAVAELAAEFAVTALAQQIGELAKHKRDLVTVAMDCLDRARGCNTPAEAFIQHILIQESLYPLTPGAVEHILEEFRDDFESMQDEASEFMKRYPTNVAEPKEAE